MSARFFLQKSSPLRVVLHTILRRLQVPGESIIDGECFKVEVEGGTAEGILSILSSVRREFPQSSGGLLGGDRAMAALVNQWVSISLQIVSQHDVGLHEFEPWMPNDAEFLCGSHAPTAADFFFYSACSKMDKAASPRVAKWVRFVEKHEEFAPLSLQVVGLPKEEIAPQPSAAAPSSKPSAEEIEKRRQEKEKVKSEKQALNKRNVDAAKEESPIHVQGRTTADTDKCDWSQLDVRVGCITAVSLHPEADKLFVELIDCGTAGMRTIVSGLVEHYKAEELQGMHVLVVCNMKPRALKGVSSQGMVLCASSDGTTQRKIEVLQVSKDVPQGTRIEFEDKPRSTASPPIPSSAKMTELLSHLHTNESGELCWKSMRATSCQGQTIRSSILSAEVK